MAEPLRLHARSGLHVAGALAGPANTDHTGAARLGLTLRRWWKQQTAQQVEDEVVDVGAGRTPIRLVLPLVLPVLGVLAVVVWSEPDNFVAFVSLVCAGGAIAYAAVADSIERRVAHPFWMQLFNAAVYAAIISGLLWTFLVFEHPRPHAHWIIFFLYFLLIGAVGLSDDPRQAICTGAFSMLGYLAVIPLLQSAAAQGSPWATRMLPEFEWVANASKLALLCAVTLLASTSAARGRAVRRTSLRDGLTGLLNRHAFDHCLDVVARRAEASAQRMTLAMIDIDQFKRLNDAHGHAAGDAVLCWVAAWLQRSFRTTDVVARYGGEEFVVAFLDSDGECVEARLEALRRGIAESVLHRNEGGEAISLSISIGVAHVPDDGTTVGEVLRIADERLYAAKATGRNRIVGASAPS